MKDFFKVTDLDTVLGYTENFRRVETEPVPLPEAAGRILSADFVSEVDLPDFPRSTVDGYAVCASSTFGASDGSPSFLTVKGSVRMGEVPGFSIGPGEAAGIPTGGMVPEGADGVVMIEQAESVDESTIEVYRSVAPGQNVIAVGEDYRKGETMLSAGQRLRPQEIGLLAAMGISTAQVYRRPLIGIISTGDEVVPIEETPGIGRIRDVNTYTLSGQVRDAGGVPVVYGIVRDHYDSLFERCSRALSECDMVLISGGSSVGTRDFTVEAISALPDARILVHGISISPGKPTILATSGNTPFWGIPGHVVSAMVVFAAVVRPFVEHIGGLSSRHRIRSRIPAMVSRNVASAQGRTDFIRVRLTEREGILWADPVLGKSGLIHTMVKADGLVEIGLNTEGLEKGTEVPVIPL